MTDQKRIPLHLAFVPEGTLHFGDLIARLAEEKTLSPTRQRDMVSGLKRVADALGLPPSDVPCDGRWLQPRLSKIRPPMLGVADKTWQNAVSNARSAMAHFGVVERRSRRTEDLDERWKVIWTAVLASDDPTIATATRRFVHFLSRLGVAPTEVTQAHADSFLEALQINEISKSPETAWRAAINGWNLARRRFADWPQIELNLPSRIVRVALKESAFPESFINDLDSILVRLADPDPFDDAAPSKPRRPSTLRQYRSQILRFASHLVQSGMPAEAIDSIIAILDPDVIKRGLRQMLDRNNGKTSRDIAQSAALLRNLARLCRAPDEQRDAIAALAAKVALSQQTGMTAKNRARLRILQDPKYRDKLLMLPERLFETYPSSAKRAHWNALAREDALVIAILLACPIRVGSLAALDLRQHIQRPGDGRVFLVLEETDTKTGRSIEFELPADVVRLLDSHLASRCPHLCPDGTPFLFPRRDGSGAIGSSELSQRISKRIKKETGLEVNPHLFRHFAVMIWLDANPGGYEVARRLLGHSDLSHTINMYSGLEVTSATKAFATLLSDLRKGSTS